MDNSTGPRVDQTVKGLGRGWLLWAIGHPPWSRLVLYCGGVTSIGVALLGLDGRATVRGRRRGGSTDEIPIAAVSCRGGSLTARDPGSYSRPVVPTFTVPAAWRTPA